MHRDPAPTLRNRSFFNQKSVSQKLLYNFRYTTPKNTGALGQNHSGDGLVKPDEIENDGAIDLPNGRGCGTINQRAAARRSLAAR